jgi:general secretion pathway protein G
MRIGPGRSAVARAGLAAKAGYSLLEILIVLAIIAMIAAFVGPRLFALLDHAKVTTARVQVRALETALQTMELDIGRYPTQGEGLDMLVKADPKTITGWQGPYLSGGLPKDPWGHAYVYEAPPNATDPPKVHSLGSDGKPGGEGNAADIYNQAGT